MKASPRIRSGVGFFFLAAAFCVSSVELSDSAPSGLGRYQSLVVSDSPALSNLVAPASSSVRVTYLGTNGYLLQTSDSAILIDPYFSRIPLMPVASNSPIKPNISRIIFGMERLPKRVDAILVTHGHFDHLLDVPEVARRTGASVIASPTSCYLSQAFGLPATKTLPVQAGDSLKFRATRVHVLPAMHDRIFGVMPFPGVRTGVPLSPPRRPSDCVWRATGRRNSARCKAHLCRRRGHGGCVASNDSRACRSGNSRDLSPRVPKEVCARALPASATLYSS
jgi:metallo-beta-lactamase superfamily protein